ncbi:MAG: T9SS type A sorting domain-containing protein [Ignavibacteria bacterium]|nr:T9SS type A sorting domain-containing protein [Ignavibacteria bacterium]
MKDKKIIEPIKMLIFTASVIVFVISQLTNITVGGKNETSNYNLPDSGYIIGYFHNGMLFDNYQYFDSLKFNTWHKYTAPSGWGWSSNDTIDNYLQDTSIYKPIVLGRLGVNRGKEIRTIMDRPIIQYLCGGQRSDYQAEQITDENQPYWFHSYESSVNNHNLGIWDMDDSSQYGNRERVKYCKSNSEEPGKNACYILEKLRANREQSNRYVNLWNSDSIYNWYIIPRVRIDSVFANRPENFNKPVFAVEAYDWEGDLVKKANIYVRNFKQDENTIYSGNYLDSFHFIYPQDTINLIIYPGNQFLAPQGVDIFNWNNDSKVDFRIYWYDNCDMWIDYVRVENEPAHQYLTQRKKEWISKVNSEVYWAMYYYDINFPNYFYFDEFEINQIPAMKEVNRQIMQGSGNKLGLIASINYNLIRANIPNCWEYLLTAEQMKTYLIDNAGFKILTMGAYPLEGFRLDEPGYEGRISYHPNTLLSEDYEPEKGILSYVTSKQHYDYWLQEHLDKEDADGMNLMFTLKFIDMLNNNIPIINFIQTHLWYARGHKLKEPSNEEIELLINLALSYNPDGIWLFGYDSGNRLSKENDYWRGILDIDTTPRHQNVYLQDKFGKVQNLLLKYNKWSTYLKRFDTTSKSYIYRKLNERNDLFNNSYINNMQTFLPIPGELQTPSQTPEHPDSTFFQATIYNNSDTYRKYFMLLNRRCSPYIKFEENENGGRRYVKIFFDSSSSSFSDFNNWKITDLYNDSTVGVFDKRNYSSVNLGWFMPGEGKLYKISPVMIDGGTLVTDEELENMEFNCDSIVNGNNKSITLKDKVTINFSSHGGINLEGGQFSTGTTASSKQIILRGQNGVKWEGLNFSDCDLISVKYTVFDNSPVSLLPPYYSYSINTSNCYSIQISNCEFNYDNQQNAGALNFVYTGEIPEENEMYIMYNTFNTINSSDTIAPTINIVASGSPVLPVLIEGNTFNLDDNGTGTAIFISGVSGAIKSNFIMNYTSPVNILNSSVDLFSNMIYSKLKSGKTGVTGILAGSSSSLNMSTSGNLYTGGKNIINLEAETVNNMFVECSIFDIDQGDNYFNIGDNSIHLNGTFPDSLYMSEVKAIGNCFKINGEDPPAVMDSVYWFGSPEKVNFIFEPFNCQGQQENGYMVFTLNEQINDTIKINNSTNQGNSFEQLHNSITIDIRARKYDSSYIKCIEFINQYPDSLLTIDILNKIYISALKSELKPDSTGNRIGNLKTYLENLIQNNTGSTSLILNAYYYIQKCKAELGEYVSALNGFETIIRQNPYSMRGLVASWDYAAVSLLAGSAGGIEVEMRINEYNNNITEEELEESEGDTLTARIMKNDFGNENRNLNNKSVTKEQKIKYCRTISEVLRNEKQKQEEELKKLETKVRERLEKLTSEKDKEVCRELSEKISRLKTLKETIKTRKPKDQIEHKMNINLDIKKIFGTRGNQGGEIKTDVTEIPLRYELYQNYPNPFNPTTKIKFDLPENTRVTIKIYDILGREMRTLLNSEYRESGRHIIEFSASGLASGVYFYRLTAGEYNAVKKMVLLK